MRTKGLQAAIKRARAAGDTEAVLILQAELERYRREYLEELEAEVLGVLKQWLAADQRGDVAEMKRLDAEHERLNVLRWEAEHGRSYENYQAEQKVRRDSA